MNNKIKQLTLNGIIAAIYVVMVSINPLSFGAIQFRLGTLLLPLSIFMPSIRTGLILGTAIANINSSLGIIDIVSGIIITSITVILIPKVNSNILKSLLYGLTSGIIVSIELYVVFKSPIAYNIITVGLSGFVIYAVGIPVMKSVSKIINKNI